MRDDEPLRNRRPQTPEEFEHVATLNKIFLGLFAAAAVVMVGFAGQAYLDQPKYPTNEKQTSSIFAGLFQHLDQR